MANKNSKNSTEEFICTNCNYTCFKIHHYNQHLLTAKHKRLTNTIFLLTKNSTEFTCSHCNKHYKHMSSLIKHKKTCVIHEKKQDDTNTTKNIITHEILLQILQQNQEQMKDNKALKELLIEQNKTIMNMVSKSVPTNQIIHNTNSHNKTFNLQVFLNETCKDAMNISEFIESLQIQVSDLENVGRVGYVDGIADIIVKNLKALDVSKRPVHCTDLKREILYVKDENKWEKDNIDKDKLRKAIKHIAHKNIKMIPAWKELNPAYVLDEGKSNDEYIQIVMKSMGGSDKAQDISYENKIISKLARCVAIDKDGIVL